MTRSVYEREHLAVAGELIRADVLGDASGLAFNDVGVPQRVEELGLPMVHMTHHRYHRGPSDQFGRIVVVQLRPQRNHFGRQLGLGLRHRDEEAELLRQGVEGVAGHRLHGCRHLAHPNQRLDQCADGLVHSLSQLLHGYPGRNFYELRFTGNGFVGLIRLSRPLARFLCGLHIVPVDFGRLLRLGRGFIRWPLLLVGKPHQLGLVVIEARRRRLDLYAQLLGPRENLLGFEIQVAGQFVYPGLSH